MDTYDIRRASTDRRGGRDRAGRVRIDSGDLGELARQARDQLDGLGATGTRIVFSGDLDEYAIASLRAEPVDSYGVGTRWSPAPGAPTAGMVYKLVEVDGRPVAKRSASKESRGGRKSALRRHKPTGTAVEEVVFPAATPPAMGPHDPVLPVPMVRGGERARPRRWRRRASACAARSSRCPGRGSSSPAASPPSRRSSRDPEAP